MPRSSSQGLGCGPGVARMSGLLTLLQESSHLAETDPCWAPARGVSLNPVPGKDPHGGWWKCCRSPAVGCPGLGDPVPSTQGSG